jgi:hypothetical protein
VTFTRSQLMHIHLVARDPFTVEQHQVEPAQPPAARDVASIAKVNVNPTDLTDPHARGASAQE